jgi:hypothetical protein
MLLYSEENSGYIPHSEYLYGYEMIDVHYTYAWTLDHYTECQRERSVDNSEEWDQLEKSIVAKLADDVIVGVRGKKVEIIIKKEF